MPRMNTRDVEAILDEDKDDIDHSRDDYDHDSDYAEYIDSLYAIEEDERDYPEEREDLSCYDPFPDYDYLFGD